MVISELPIGSIVQFGRYQLGHMTCTTDISWIKVSKGNYFISEKVLIGAAFDAYESNWRTNNDYSLSNIRQFMNSDVERWYMPTHQHDKEMGYIFYEDTGYTVNTNRYKGLLHYFTDVELDAFEHLESGDFLRLPTKREIDGGFQYFIHRGRKAHAVDEYGSLERKDYFSGMFSAYYVLDEMQSVPDGEVCEVTRSGQFRNIWPHIYSGVRPVCKLKADIEVISVGENTYEMNLSSVTPVKYFEETQSLDWLLGL